MNLKKLQRPGAIIAYKQKSPSDSIAIKLFNNTGHILVGFSDEDVLSHDSPEITRIHDAHYLSNLEKHPSAMLAVINNNPLIALYPNAYSSTYLKFLLTDTTTTLEALKKLIVIKNQLLVGPPYIVSLGNGNSFAGCDKGCNGDVYASIPIAAAYALDSKLFNHILIIDENIDRGNGDISSYYLQGNGEIFCDKEIKHNNGIFRSDNIIVYDDRYVTMKTVEDILDSHPTNIDLALYNVETKIPITKENRIKNLTILFKKLIPTLIILSGDKNKNLDQTCEILDYIVDTANNVDDCDGDFGSPYSSTNGVAYNSSIYSPYSVFYDPDKDENIEAVCVWESITYASSDSEDQKSDESSSSNDVYSTSLNASDGSSDGNFSLSYNSLYSAQDRDFFSDNESASRGEDSSAFDFTAEKL